MIYRCGRLLSIGPHPLDDQPGSEPQRWFAALPSQPGAGKDVNMYAFDNGLDRVAGVVDEKDAGFYPGLMFDPNAVAYGTYCTATKKNKSKAKWVRIGLPDLAGTLDGVTETEDGGGWNVAGTLAIKKYGLGKAVKNSVLLYVSDDAEFDEGDTVLPGALKVYSLNPRRQ